MDGLAGWSRQKQVKWMDWLDGADRSKWDGLNGWMGQTVAGGWTGWMELFPVVMVEQIVRLLCFYAAR